MKEIAHLLIASRVLCRMRFSASRSRAANRASVLRSLCCRIFTSSSAVPAHRHHALFRIAFRS